MPKHRGASQSAQDADKTTAFFNSDPAHDSCRKAGTQGCLHIGKPLALEFDPESNGLTSESLERVRQNVRCDSRIMARRLGNPDSKATFKYGLKYFQKSAKRMADMVHCLETSMWLSAYAQQLDQNPTSWEVVKSECRSYDMTHLQAIAENSDKDVVRHEVDEHNLRHHTDSSTLEASFDSVNRTITEWGYAAAFYWMEVCECNIEKRFGLRNEQYQCFLAEAHELMGDPPLKEIRPSPVQIWEDPQTYSSLPDMVIPEKAAKVKLSTVPETIDGEKLAEQGDEMSKNEEDEKIKGTNDINSDDYKDSKTDTTGARRKSQKARSNGKKAKNDRKRSLEKIDRKTIKTQVEYAQKTTDCKNRNKGQTPDVFMETTKDHEQEKENKTGYDALGQCTRVIGKLDELVLQIKLATEEAHAINTSTATSILPLADSYWGAIVLDGVVDTTCTKLPKSMLQDMSDMMFLKAQADSIEPILRRERDRIRETFQTWCRSDSRIWAFGCAHQLDMPILRSYEYHRNSFLASTQVVMRRDIRVTNFLRSPKGDRYRSPEVEAALVRPDVEHEWEQCFLNFNDQCKSVEEMIAEVNKAGEYWGGVDKIPTGEWFRWTEPIVGLNEIDAEKLEDRSGFGTFLFKP